MNNAQPRAISAATPTSSTINPTPNLDQSRADLAEHRPFVRAARVSRARFMCHAPECDREMRAIRDGAMHDETFTLDCGHTRSKAVPPLTPGRISLENIGSTASLIAFPPPVVTL
jgi:hypothetical protein